jgi:GNAT superfamily N-acetyltransferase
VSELSVRDARPADAEAIARVARASWKAAYQEYLDPAYVDAELADGYAVPTLARDIALLAGVDACFFVAERAGAVVGYLHYAPVEDGPYLRRLYVHPDHWRTGVGDALLEELHRRIGPETSYTLDVHPRNEQARAFYARRGFVDAGRLPPPFTVRLRWPAQEPERAGAASPSENRDPEK